MKDFMPKKNQQKKLIENVLAISAKARKEKEMNPSIINATGLVHIMMKVGKLRYFVVSKRPLKSRIIIIIYHIVV